MEPFRFKRFVIAHDQCAFKVGTDGVLLAAWASLDQVRTVLDVGTGSGVIALMMAQRGAHQVDAVEIHRPSFLQAQDNFEHSSWNKNIKAWNRSFQEHAEISDTFYDLIISNPPFFNSGTRSADIAKRQSRHTDSLPQQELLRCTIDLLEDTGKLCLVLPVEEGLQYIDAGKSCGLVLTRKAMVHSKPNQPANRVLLEFTTSKVENVYQEQIHIRDESGEYSAAYRNLTRDFYLAF